MFFLLMMTDPFQFPSFYLDPLLLSLPLFVCSSSSLSLSFSFSKTANNDDDDDDNRADNDNVDDYDDNDEGVAKRRHAPSLSSPSSFPLLSLPSFT